MPITYEQPAIAQRVRWVGAGEMMPISQLNPAHLCALIGKLLGERAYADAARRIADAIRAAGGVKRARHIIESVGR